MNKQQRYAVRQQEKGNRLVKVWVPAEDVQAVKDFARTMRERKESRGG